MTTVNNYDTKKDGVAIEATYYLDTDASRRLFEESIEVIQHDGYRTTSIGYYMDNGNVAGHDVIEWILKGSDDDAIKWLASESEFNEDELKSWPIEEVRQDIIDRNSPNLIDYAMERSFDFDMSNTGLEIVPNKTLIVLTTRGYSQGDYAKVIYCPDDLQAAWGTEPKQADIQKTVNHLYWDAPAYARIEIDGKTIQNWDDNKPNEYVLYDMPEYDEYDFDRDKFLAWVAEQSGVSLEELEAVFPTEPDYI